MVLDGVAVDIRILLGVWMELGGVISVLGLGLVGFGEFLDFEFLVGCGEECVEFFGFF